MTYDDLLDLSLSPSILTCLNTTDTTLGIESMRPIDKSRVSYPFEMSECCNPSTHTNSLKRGYIALCTAENKLVQEALASRLMRQGTAITAFSDSSSYCHASSLGLYNAREAVAYFLQKRFLRKDLSMGMHRVDDSLTTPLNYQLNDGRTQFDPQSNAEKHIIHPDHIAFGAGVNSLISEVLYSIASTGDVVLIPAPYYAAFDYDVKTIARCEPRPVYMENPILGPTVADLENAAQIAEKVNFQICFLRCIPSMVQGTKLLLTLELNIEYVYIGRKASSSLAPDESK